MDIHQAALDKWGPAPMIFNAIAASADLVSVLSQTFFLGQDVPAAVADKVAKVEIMCAQLHLLIDSEQIEQAKKEQLRQLRARLSEV